MFRPDFPLALIGTGQCDRRGQNNLSYENYSGQEQWDCHMIPLSCYVGLTVYFILATMYPIGLIDFLKMFPTVPNMANCPMCLFGKLHIKQISLGCDEQASIFQ